MVMIVNAPTAASIIVNSTNVNSRRIATVGTAPGPNTRCCYMRRIFYLDLRAQTLVASDAKGANFIERCEQAIAAEVVHIIHFEVALSWSRGSFECVLSVHRRAEAGAKKRGENAGQTNEISHLAASAYLGEVLLLFLVHCDHPFVDFI
jgi:hypothetical protein